MKSEVVSSTDFMQVDAAMVGGGKRLEEGLVGVPEGLAGVPVLDPTGVFPRILSLSSAGIDRQACLPS